MTTRDILAQTFTIISGDEINMTVKKASTRVNLPPKQKHIKALHQFIQNPRANLVHLVDCFSQRFRKNNWMISLKALLTAHHLMNDSNQAFLLQVSRRPHLFEIPGWIDNSSSYSVDVSPRIVRYSKYLSLKSECFRTYQKDLTAKKAIQEVFTVGDIKQVLSQMEFIDRLGKSLDDTCIDFSLSSPIFHAQNVTLLREKLRVYSALNERMIFILKNLNELEASDAVKVIPYYEELCSSHRTIERLIHIAAGKGVDGVSEVRLKAPSSELVESLRDLVKEIIRTRGPPRLKKEWQVEDEPAGRNVAEKHNMIMGIVSSNTDVIPSSVTQDNFNIFWADQPTSIFPLIFWH
ncbi:Phosphatidylinositol-binding clathrin assembly protein [Thelohanellus kitauei]|uniref:Phosphatidylinositol-binding clathrin assembly protein n=1 Tax=Thelohanellus kitauei TaxID=669202 RepID=A0A0C2M7Y6_THEKT|nr:Phosphatidylinositol-binding clathrin assembly protein [Thelohanellus kitauei]